jgi:hypothetical protein
MLHLASASNTRDAAPMAASAAGTNAGSGAYVLTGTLPDGQPADQSVWRLATPTANDAARVAAALGLPGTPARVNGGWVLRDGSNRLVVRDDSGWSYGMDCAPDQPVSSEDLSVMCAYAMSSGVAVAAPPPDAPAPDPSASDAPKPGSGSGSGSGAGGCDPAADVCSGGSATGGGPATDVPPSPYPVPDVSPGPSESGARSAAATVFDKLGIGDATITFYSGDPSATVQASPRVGGLRTSGWVTSLQIDGNMNVVSADGWLDNADKRDAYPVITAQRAFELLQEQPRPMMEMCMQRKDGKPGCADIPPTEITGASLGLVLDYEAERPLLVPAWLFDIKDQSEPFGQIAVDPAYLAPPPTASADPGTPDSVPPVEASPAESAPASAPARGAPEPVPATSTP